MNITGVNAGYAVQGGYAGSGSSADAGISGHVGDVIEGVVRKVSDEVTIDFNGKEINVSKSAVQDAREGDSVKFQIMDVSDNRIVLKAVDNSESQPQGATSTVLETESKADSIESDVVDNQAEEVYINIENITGEDVRAVFDVLAGTLEDPGNIGIEAFDRLVEAIKSKRLIELSSIEGQQEKIEQLRKAIDSAAVKNRLPQGISKVIAEYFVRYDIPVTEEKLEQLGNALNQTENVNAVNSQMIKYMLRNEMPITAENMYNAEFMCGVEYVEENNAYKDNIFEEMVPQVRDIVASSGYEWDEDMKDRTKWLFRNDIAINEQTLHDQDVLLGLSQNGVNPEEAVDNMVQGITDGDDPAKVTLYTTQYKKSEQAVIDFQRMTDEAVDKVVDSGELLNLENLRKYCMESQVHSGSLVSDTVSGTAAITARRQLEEIRLSMTIQAARTLNDRGIDVDTAELSRIVDGLRQIENDYYKNLLQSGGLEGTDEEIDIISETQYCRTRIENAPVYLLSDIVSEGMKQTVPECSDAAAGMSAVYDRAGEAYEKLMTSPRSDMGDSIQKAFTNVDSILNELGLDVTAENQRIVRVLAHNNMELTVNNVDSLRGYDARMQHLLNNLKPDTTLELIRNGSNPLKMSMDELNAAIDDINHNLDDGNQDRGENGYSRFLWKLEKENRITPEERSSYIGIYRLMNHVTRDDNAAIGAVKNAGMELNLKNLLTAVRSRRDSGMDEVIDDESGIRESMPLPGNIDEQVEAAFEYSYEMYCADRMTGTITPSKLYDVSDGSLDSIMEQPLEQLTENLEQSDGNEKLEDEYYEQLASDYRELSSANKVLAFLKGNNIEATLFNANCAKQILDTGQTVLSDILKLRGKDDAKASGTSRGDPGDEYEEAVNGLTDALESDETMQAQAEKAGTSARKLLLEREQQVLSTGDLASLRSMEDALRFNRLMSGRRNYEIPIQTDNGVTNINLTLLSSGSEKGRVEIRMDTASYGDVACRFDITGSRVQGLVLSESDNIYDSGLLGDIRESIEKLDMQVVSLSQGIHKVTGAYIPDSGENEAEGTAYDTAGLYRLAKSVVRTISTKL